MKKRLLITSIVMMLVVAVALSTATYAWFTSNARVEASSINLTAATSSAPAFGISWTGNNDYSTALEDIVGPSAGFNPLVPETYSTTSPITEDSVTFYTATMRQEGGAEKYNDDVKLWSTTEEAKEAAQRAENYNLIAKPYIWNNGTVNSFWIKNLSTSVDQSHLYVSATVTGAAADMVRIAIFDTGNLKGILGYNYTYSAVAELAEYSSTTTYYKAVTGGYLPETVADATAFAAKKATLFTRSAAPVAAPVYYGEIEKDEDVLISHTNSSLSIDLTAFSALEAREITVYVWLDGKYLNDDTQNTGASIDLVFTSTDPYAA